MNKQHYDQITIGGGSGIMPTASAKKSAADYKSSFEKSSLSSLIGGHQK
jgi:hypothetical protein